MPSSPQPPADLRAAVDRANVAIRGFWARVGDELSPAEWVEHERLQQAWGVAVAELGQGEGGEPALAA